MAKVNKDKAALLIKVIRSLSRARFDRVAASLFHPVHHNLIVRMLSSAVSFSNVQIQPMKVMTRKGYAKNGNGEEVGVNCSPQKILVAVRAKRSEATMPERRTPMANSLGILTSRRAVAHKAAPPAKAGTLPAEPAAVPESIMPSPIANTRNPAATKSFPFLQHSTVSRVAAITRPARSISHRLDS